MKIYSIQLYTFVIHIGCLLVILIWSGFEVFVFFNSLFNCQLKEEKKKHLSILELLVSCYYQIISKKYYKNLLGLLNYTQAFNICVL